MRVFIGSSSKADAAGDLQTVVKLLEAAALIPIPWTAPEVFPANVSIWASLLEQLASVDAAAFIFREDDLLQRADSLVGFTRDNVLLEFGMFCGGLAERARINFSFGRVASAEGSRNCAIFKKGNPTIPSDLAGVLLVSLDERESARGKVLAWAQTMRTQISQGYNLDDDQIAAIVKAMRDTEVPHSEIIQFLRNMRVVTPAIDRAMQ